MQQTYESNPDNPAAYISYSKFLAAYHENRQELTDLALEVMQQALKKFPDDPSVYSRLITMHLTRHEGDAAQEVLEEGLNRPNPDPYYWLRMAPIAQAVYRNGEEALERINDIFEKALELGRGDSVVENAVADYFSDTKQYAKARDLYEQIVMERPEELNARQKLAAVYSILKQPDLELETLLKLEKINPHRPETQRYLAERFYRTQDYERAAEHFTKALRLEPGSARDYEILTRLLLVHVDRPEEALAVVERAIFHFPDVMVFKHYLGSCLIALEMYEEAYQVFLDSEEAIFKAGSADSEDLLDTSFYFYFGAAAERTERFEEAAEFFRKSIELVPSEYPAWAAAPYNYLGYMWLEQDMNIDEAGELIIRANELSPEPSAAYIDSLGWFYFKKQRYEEALDKLLEAEALMAADNEADAVIFDHIGQTYFELGKREEAIQYLERAIAEDPETVEYKERLERYRNAPEPKPAGEAETESKEEEPAPDSEDSEGSKDSEDSVEDGLEDSPEPEATVLEPVA